jgi:hypothetical protein
MWDACWYGFIGSLVSSLFWIEVVIEICRHFSRNKHD